MAQLKDAVGMPADWDKAVAAAYLRLIGQSQNDSAKGAGVGRRTLQRWEISDWWPDACEEASGRWLSHLVSTARVSLARGVAVNPGLAMTVLERVDARLAPAAQRHEHSGPGGGPIESRELTDDELLERAHDHAARLVSDASDGTVR